MALGEQPGIFAMTQYCQLLSALTVVFAFTASAGAQSLGDVARKEEARRKAVRSVGKIYTNESLKDQPPMLPAPQASAAASGAPQAASASSAQEQAGAAEQKPDEPKKDEAYWRARMTEAREGLARAQTFQEALQSRINALSTDFVNRDDPAQRSRIAADRQKALAELDRVKREIQSYQKSIVDIEEEARRAGVPPGWLR